MDTETDAGASGEGVRWHAFVLGDRRGRSLRQVAYIIFFFVCFYFSFECETEESLTRWDTWPSLPVVLSVKTA